MNQASICGFVLAVAGQKLSFGLTCWRFLPQSGNVFSSSFLDKIPEKNCPIWKDNYFLKKYSTVLILLYQLITNLYYYSNYDKKIFDIKNLRCRIVKVPCSSKFITGLGSSGKSMFNISWCQLIFFLSRFLWIHIWWP